MMERRDISMSIGEKSASDVDELGEALLWRPRKRKPDDAPHTSKVLHHELVNGFCWVGHVNFSFSIFEVRLELVNTTLPDA
jgi:hypothetical protein